MGKDTRVTKEALKLIFLVVNLTRIFQHFCYYYLAVFAVTKSQMVFKLDKGYFSIASFLTLIYRTANKFFQLLC